MNKPAEHYNLPYLRQWRDSLKVDDAVLTRECRTGIISHIPKKSRKFSILQGKGHEVKVAKDDLFPLDWMDVVDDWRGRKSSRGPDIPLEKHDGSRTQNPDSES